MLFYLKTHSSPQRAQSAGSSSMSFLVMESPKPRSSESGHVYAAALEMLDLTPIFILGCTASAKSAVAVSLARLMSESAELPSAEIVSADAYQVYRDLPILTAAPSESEQGGVPHHLIGCMSLAEHNDAAKHARAAQQSMLDIQDRGRRPIVTGGSGLYVKFISHGISEAPPSDASLRAQLEELSCEQLCERFAQIDPEGLAATATDNRRYLLRNLEMVIAGSKPLSHWRQNWTEPAIGRGWIISREVEDIDARIARRAGEMLDGALLEEVSNIQGIVISDTAQKTLGLSLIQSHLAAEISREELQQSLSLMTRRYAKRQRTWLRRESWLEQLDANEENPQEIAQKILAKLEHIL